MRLVDIESLDCIAYRPEDVTEDTFDAGALFILNKLDSLPVVYATPCSMCRHNPPSSMGGKPCSYCPAAPIVMISAGNMRGFTLPAPVDGTLRAFQKQKIKADREQAEMTA